MIFPRYNLNNGTFALFLYHGHDITNLSIPDAMPSLAAIEILLADRWIVIHSRAAFLIDLAVIPLPPFLLSSSHDPCAQKQFPRNKSSSFLSFFVRIIVMQN